MEFWKRKKKGKVKEEEPSKFFLKNGSTFLQQFIEDCNGKSNPIRFFSSHQISNSIDLKSPLSDSGFFSWYNSVIEGRPYMIKKFTKSYLYRRDTAYYNDIALSARVSNHNGILKLIGCCLEFELPVMVFENSEYGVLNERGSVGSEDGPFLPWNVKLKIAKDIAIAVTYLHMAFSRIIIHRDIKVVNVLLDENLNMI